MKLIDLKPLEKNPFRSKGDEQLARIGKSIQEFEKMMSIRKIVIDETNTILGGNKRYFALKMLGYKEIPDTWIDKRTDLTEEEKQRFVVTDNAHFGSEWDNEMLNEIKQAWDIDLKDWGVEIDFVDYSEKNKEIDTDFIDDNFYFKLEYSESEYLELKEKIMQTGKTPEQIFYEALISV